MSERKRAEEQPKLLPAELKIASHERRITPPKKFTSILHADAEIAGVYNNFL